MTLAVWRNRFTQKKSAPVEDDEYKPIEVVVVSGAEFDRSAFLRTVSAAVHSLTETQIISSWVQSHLYPFVPVPPTSTKSQKELERQIRISGMITRRKHREPTTVPLTGFVNQLRAESKVKPVPVNKLVTYETKSKNAVTVHVRQKDRNADVGDTALVLKTGKRITLSCQSNADIVITVDD